MWYVIQVRTGMEEEIRQQCERVIEKEILENCFIPYNMHWLAHPYALPSPGKDRKWCLAGDTARGMLETPGDLAEQKSIDLTFRSVSVLVSAPCEKKDTGKKSRPQRKNTTGKDGQGKK